MSRKSLATLYGIGLVKHAPGTAGSLAAAILAWGLLQCPHGWGVLAVGMIAVMIIGTVAADRYMRMHAIAHDPKEVVIDEVAGQWLTYLIWYMMIAGAAAPSDVSFTALDVDVGLQFLVLGFLLFRLFDIVKPWPISWADRTLKGGFGVMFDDLLAAIPAGILLYLAYVFSPLVFGTLESLP